MSEKLNATCDICGKKYHICNTCKDITSFTPWRTITDTIEHYKIFLILSEYTQDKDKNKAREDLLSCDLSELESFNENIKKAIKEIMEEKNDKQKLISSSNDKKNVKKVSTKVQNTTKEKTEDSE